MGWNFKSVLATDPGGRGRPGDQASESDLQGRIQCVWGGGGVRTAPPNFIKKEKALHACA